MLDDLTDDNENYPHPLSTRRKTGHHQRPKRRARSIEGLHIVANN